MGNVNAIPVVSQVKSAVQAIGGDSDGALKTQEEFSKQCPGVSQVRSAVEATYDAEAALRTQMEFVNNLESVADGTPVIGHVKGAVHYALNDTEKGDECMKSASRTTAVIAAGVATGGSGLVVAAAAGTVAGVAMDGVTTGVDSAVHKEYRPNGIIQAVSGWYYTRLTGA